MGNDNVKDYPPYLDYPKESNQPIGAKPGWLCSAQRIAELAGAINRYAEDGHGDFRRILIRGWAEEIILQCDIWDKVTEQNEKRFTQEVTDA